MNYITKFVWNSQLCQQLLAYTEIMPIYTIGRNWIELQPERPRSLIIHNARFPTWTNLVRLINSNHKLECVYNLLGMKFKVHLSNQSGPFS